MELLQIKQWRYLTYCLILVGTYYVDFFGLRRPYMTQ